MPNIVKQKEILQELESDDEFPTEYNEVFIPPAYQIENRFDMIEFKWINNVKPSNNEILSDTESNSSDTSDSEIPPQILAKNSYPKPLIHKGVLKKHDLFCLKSIQGFTHDSTLLWLINFLVYKDIQSDYEFLKSCLVSNTMYNERMDVKHKSPSSETNNFYNIVIKT